jgi:hypothetical protein
MLAEADLEFTGTIRDKFFFLWKLTSKFFWVMIGSINHVKATPEPVQQSEPGAAAEKRTPWKGVTS